MKKTILLVFISLILISQAYADDYIIIESKNIDSFGGLIPGNKDIYVGSTIRYNISLKNDSPINFSSLRFDVIIKNPSDKIIEDSSFFFNAKENSEFNILSNISKTDWKLIYADVPGIYQLIISIYDPKIELYERSYYENSYMAYRHSSSLPFFFEVRSPEEKRMLDTNEEMLKTSKYTYIASIAMLIVAFITLISTNEGRNIIMKILKGFTIVIVALMLILIFIAFLQTVL